MTTKSDALLLYETKRCPDCGFEKHFKNSGLGQFKDNRQYLLLAADYLERAHLVGVE